MLFSRVNVARRLKPNRGPSRLANNYPFEILKWVLILLLALVTSDLSAGSAPTIATASNFKSTMESLLQSKALNLGKSKNIYASSGKLLAQITNGAPIDVFLSAEPIGEKLDANLVVEGSEFTYAYGQLAFVSRSSDENLPLDSAKNLTCLTIANPKLAPYGRAAIEVVKKLEQQGWQFERIIQGQSVAQAFQFFDSGACDSALVAYAQVLAGNQSAHHRVIPSDWHAPIQQNAIFLKRAENTPGAKQFLEFLQSDSARKIIKDAGYLTDIE